MASLNYGSIYSRIRSRPLLNKTDTELPDVDLTLPAHDVAADLFARYPCLGSEASLAVSEVQVRYLESAIASKVAALLSEGAGGSELLSASEIKQGSVTIKQGGAVLDAKTAIQGFWDGYASSLRSITCIGTGGRAIFATSGARTEPSNAIEEAFGPEEDA